MKVVVVEKFVNLILDSLEKDIKLKLVCEPIYDFEHTFLNFKTYVVSSDLNLMDMESLWGLWEPHNTKEIGIKDIRSSYCDDCDFDIFEDKEFKCDKCNKIPSDEELEKIYYDEIYSSIIKRLEEIQKEVE